MYICINIRKLFFRKIGLKTDWAKLLMFYVRVSTLFRFTVAIFSALCTLLQNTSPALYLILFTIENWFETTICSLQLQYTVRKQYDRKV